MQPAGQTAEGAVVERSLVARAYALGDRLATRDLPARTAESAAPLTLRTAGGGRAILFRFGAAVFLGVSPEDETALLGELRARVPDPYEPPEREDIEVLIARGATEGADPAGRVVLRDFDLGRAQVVASVLAKSATLAHHERRLASTFDRVEALALRLRSPRRPARSRELIRQIGDVLVTRVRMVGRVEIGEKPEITWDDPGLYRLYERLAGEFELRERDRALSRKLDLVSDIARTYLEMIHSRAALRLEWYIVVLILVEIVLSLYGMFGPTSPW